MTISGAAIGRNSTLLTNPRPLKLCRTIANAIIVPRIVATSVASRAISSDSSSGSCRMPSSSGFFHASRENFSHFTLYLPEGLLNDIHTTTKFGTSRKKKIRKRRWR